MNFFSNSVTASSSRIPRSTIIPTSDSSCSFTYACSAAKGEILSLRSVECVAGYALIGFPVLLPRSGDHVRRERRGRRLFVPADALEIVAHVLLVKRGLRLARRILSRGPEARGVGSQRFIDPDEFVSEEPELEFRVGDDDPVRRRVLGGAAIERETYFPQALGQRAADPGNRLLERDVFIVAGSGFRRGSE